MRKSSIRNMLSTDERRKYDELIYAASFDETGRRYPSHEIGERMHGLLLDAVQAQERWASWVMAEDARCGHIRRFKAWDRIRHPVRTMDGGRIIRLSGVQALRRRNSPDEAMFWQDTEYGDMTAEDLDAIIDYTQGRIAPLSYNLNTAKALRVLVDGQPKGVKVRAVLAARGKTIDEYLQERAA